MTCYIHVQQIKGTVGVIVLILYTSYIYVYTSSMYIQQKPYHNHNNSVILTSEVRREEDI